MMIRQVTKINWAYIGDAVPSFITLAFIPFSFSCAYGLIALVGHILFSTFSFANKSAFSGLFAYIIVNGAIYIVVKVSGETITPEKYELKEYWSWRPPGDKPWIIRAVVRCIDWARYKKDRDTSFSLNSRDDAMSTEQYRSDTSKDGQMPRISTLDPEPMRRMY